MNPGKKRKKKAGDKNLKQKAKTTEEGKASSSVLAMTALGGITRRNSDPWRLSYQEWRVCKEGQKNHKKTIT